MLGEIIFWLICLVGTVGFFLFVMPDSSFEISEYALDRINGKKY